MSTTAMASAMAHALASTATREGKVSRDWRRVEKMKEAGSLFRGRVEAANRGGVVLRVGRLAGFVPMSQIEAERVADGAEPAETRLEKLVGKRMVVRVLECDPRGKLLILSEKAAATTLAVQKLEVGMTCRGKVRMLADFGAFVDVYHEDTGIRGAEGLVHVSELSWDPVVHPSKVVGVGQEVILKVISLDAERNRIGLSLRQTETDPLLETLDMLMPVVEANKQGRKKKGQPDELLPELVNICRMLQEQPGILQVEPGRRVVERRVVSQELEIWLTNSQVQGGYNLLARLGNKVQELHVVSPLSREEIKDAVARVLEEAAHSQPFVQ